MTKKVKQRMAVVFILVTAIFLLLPALNFVAQAAGLVDDTVDTANEYSRYPLENYQLDFYVDNSWAWLPWNWKDGIGNSVMYGLYLLTNVIWTGSLYISNGTGYVVQEAYNLDFISDMADTVGKNMQTLAGVSSKGISTEGFYVGFLLLFILIVGIYVAYTGLVKRETSKAVGAVLNFVLVFIVSGAFIAYAPDCVGRINGFSSDVSNAALELGTKISMPGSSSSNGRNSVDLIRDNLFNIQVIQPWKLLQYGTTDVEKTRVEKLVSVSPDLNSGEDREEVVKDEIENQGNTSLSLTKVVIRLGMVFFLVIMNIGISFFIFLLTGIMIFSQVLFIVYVMFLPMSFLMGMLPTYESQVKKSIEKVFNTIIIRAGITLVITVAFSVSSMFYSVSDGYPFFMTAFLQIVTFAGIYIKLGDIMGMFSLNGSNDAQQMGRRLYMYPRMWSRRISHRVGWRVRRNLNRAVTAGMAGAAAGSIVGRKGNSPGRVGGSGQDVGVRGGGSQAMAGPEKQPRQGRPNVGQRAGQKVGAAMDMKKRIQDNAGSLKDQVKNTPTNMRYAAYATKKTARDKVKQNIEGFRDAVTETREKKALDRVGKTSQQRQTVAERRRALEQERDKKDRIRNGNGETRKNTRNRKLKEGQKADQNVVPTRTDRGQTASEMEKKKVLTRPNIQKATFSGRQEKQGQQQGQQKIQTADRSRTVDRAEPLINGKPLSQSKDAAIWTGERQGKRGMGKEKQKKLSESKKRGDRNIK